MAHLNGAGETFAHAQIAAGKVNKSASWSFSADDGNALLGDWTNYGKHHLGVDPAEPVATKAHYKYPFAKGDTVYRSGLIAAKQRAAQQGATDIENAAGRLIDMIDGNQGDQSSRRRPPPFNAALVAAAARFARRSAFDLVMRPMSQSAFSMRDNGWYRVAQVEGEPKTAEVLIYDEIGGWFGLTASDFARDIAGLGAIDTLKLRINSPGGSVFDGVAIYNTLVQHPAHIDVYVDGWAASIASVIAMAGDTIHIGESAQFMVHQPWSIVLGTADDMRKEAGILDSIEANLIGIYESRTGQDRAKLTDMVKAETWLKGQEAVDLGFADVLIPNKTKTEAKPAARLDAEFFATIFPRLPPDVLNALADPVKPADMIQTERQFERYLRIHGGFSAHRAKAIASAGFKAPEPVRDEPPAPSQPNADRRDDADRAALVEALKAATAKLNPL
jgi:ATP-dependent protease ClpP protease subunit